MDNSPPEKNGGVFPNARDFHIDEQNNYNVNGNQYVQVFTSDQATLIQALNPILDASHTRDLATCPPNSACFPDTRVDVIKVLVEWADSTLLWNTHILWLHGFVGCGKSALALAVALKFERRNRLVGSFFFFRNTGDRCKMIRFAATLAFQLAVAIPEAAPFINKAIRDGGLQVTSLVAQLRRLVYEPFKAAVKRIGTFKAFFKPFLIVVDGLDECEDHQEVRAFIDDLLLFFKKNPFIPLRFLITSRVEQHIQGQLEKGHVRLLDLVNRCSRRDLEVFMDKCFEEVKKRNPVIKAYIRDHGDWPTKEDKATLVDHIDGSFIFGSALFKYIIDPTDTSSTPMERLPHTLNMNPGLDILYARTLSRSQDIPHFHEVISTLALAFEPLPIVGIADLLGIKTFQVVRVLINLQAIIHIPGTDILPVTICHTSLRDFLTTEIRSGRFFTSPHFHLQLMHRCSIPRTEQKPDAAVVLYSSAHGVHHFEKIPPAMRGLITHLPQIPDGVYTHILEESRGRLFFSDIISIIALEPSLPSVSQMSELFEIDISKLLKVLANLQPIILLPESTDTPPTVRFLDFRQFLKDESRSGRFFVSPSSHFKLSYYHFNLSFNLRLLESEESTQEYGLSHSHWLQLGAISGREVQRLTLDLPFHTSMVSRDLFSFTRCFLLVFEDTVHDSPVPEEILDILIECASSLASSMECRTAADFSILMGWNFHQVGRSFMKKAYKAHLKIWQNHVVAMSSNLRRAEETYRVQVY
ncbi:hypothetical protein MD484_g6814, partial [Candolleomyces efflorescens]